MSPTTRRRAAIYARVSTIDQTGDHQLPELRRYVKRRYTSECPRSYLERSGLARAAMEKPSPGLVRLSCGDEIAAFEAFDRGLASDEVNHVGTRQACANAWCAIGAVRLQHRR